MSGSNIVEILEKRITIEPEKIAFTFLEYNENGRTDINITIKNLYDTARSVAVKLLWNGLKKNDRVLIFSTEKYDNVYSIYGAIFAGAIFTMVPPPVDESKFRRFKMILKSSQAKFILCSSKMSDLLRSKPEINNLLQHNCNIIQVDDVNEDPDIWIKPEIKADDLAYLQFSSGSTSFPKGVSVSHKNLIHNLECLSLLFSDDLVTSVSWVPFFHNMGLVGFIFFNIYHGFRSVQLTPSAFMQKPARWFEAITQFKARLTAGPNSAYGLCANIINNYEINLFDLSSLKYAINGSEPLNWQSISMFIKKFEKAHFHKDSFCPAYGLAESTMFVAGSYRKINMKKGDCKKFLNNVFDENQIAGVKKKEIISVGKLFCDSKSVIVDPLSGRECEENCIGEIWLQSDSVAQGYWNLPQETEMTFRATLKDHEGYFLRTGDLGIVLEGELFVTGRCKEMIIINGNNLYPQDIELSIKQSIPSFALCQMAVFSVIVSEKERIVIGVEENTSGIDRNILADKINQAVYDNFEIVPYDMFFVNKGILPRTDNGKIQILKAKKCYEDGEYKDASILQNKSDKLSGEIISLEEPEIADDVELKIKHIFEKIIKTEKRITNQDSFFHLGGDSLDTVHLVSLLESEFGISFKLNQLVENPTVKGISEYIKTVKENKDTKHHFHKKYLYVDSSLPEDITLTSSAELEVSNPKNVFLTGATGFLGAHLIRSLIDSTNALVYCHVRAANVEKGFERIKKNMEKYKVWEDCCTERIKPVLGDLSKPYMGIDKNYYIQLTEIIDSIYHNGALLNFIFPYDYLKNTNVFGTTESIKFACYGRAKHYNYISSYSVYDNPSHFCKKAMEDDELSSGDGYFLGYSETKWVSEKLVRAAEKKGLAVTIFRPGEISGSSTQGLWDMSDMISRIIVACIQTEAVPDIDVKVFLTPVDYVAESITHLSTQMDSIGKAYNLINKNISTIKELFPTLKSLGYDVKLVPYLKWRDMLYNSENDLKLLLSLFDVNTRSDTSFVRRYSDMHADIDISNTISGLSGTGIECHAVDAWLITKYLNNFANKGFIPFPDVPVMENFAL